MQPDEEQDDPGQTPLLLAQAGLSLLLSGWLLSTLERPQQPPYALGLAALGVVLEVTAVRWPGMGFSSSAPACYLALALLSGSPVGLAALALVVGLLLRSLSRGGPGFWLRLREATASALPVLLALAVARVATSRGAGPWLGFLLIDVYLPVAFLAP